MLQANTGGIVNWVVILGITGLMAKWWVVAPRNGTTDRKRGDHRTRSRTVGNLVQQVCAAERLTRFHLETHN